MGAGGKLKHVLRSPYAGRFLKADLRYAPYSFLVNRVAGSALVPRIVRLAIYRLAGLDVGLANLYPGLRFLGHGPVHIANSASINSGVVFDNKTAPIVIEEDAGLGPDVFLLTSDHDVGGRDRRAGPFMHKPITIQRGAWIGARAVIMPGVTVGFGSIVGAGAVVFRDTDPNGLYTGNPARKIEDLTARDLREK